MKMIQYNNWDHVIGEKPIFLPFAAVINLARIGMVQCISSLPNAFVRQVS